MSKKNQVLKYVDKRAFDDYFSNKKLLWNVTVSDQTTFDPQSVIDTSHTILEILKNEKECDKAINALVRQYHLPRDSQKLAARSCIELFMNPSLRFKELQNNLQVKYNIGFEKNKNLSQQLSRILRKLRDEDEGYQMLDSVGVGLAPDEENSQGTPSASWGPDFKLLVTLETIFMDKISNEIRDQHQKALPFLLNRKDIVLFIVGEDNELFLWKHGTNPPFEFLKDSFCSPYLLIRKFFYEQNVNITHVINEIEEITNISFGNNPVNLLRLTPYKSGGNFLIAVNVMNNKSFLSLFAEDNKIKNVEDKFDVKAHGKRKYSEWWADSFEVSKKEDRIKIHDRTVFVLGNLYYNTITDSERQLKIKNAVVNFFENRREGYFDSVLKDNIDYPKLYFED